MQPQIPHTSYLICATPRCGSSLLAEVLKNTGIASRPEEWVQRYHSIKRTRQNLEAYLIKGFK